MSNHSPTAFDDINVSSSSIGRVEKRFSSNGVINVFFLIIFEKNTSKAFWLNLFIYKKQNGNKNFINQKKKNNDNNVTIFLWLNNYFLSFYFDAFITSQICHNRNAIRGFNISKAIVRFLLWNISFQVHPWTGYFHCRFYK